MDKVFDIFAYLMGKQAGGGGGDISVVSKSISSNGTFTAPPGKAYSPVTVSVPASAVDSGTKSITSNGTDQDVVGYAAVDVAVPNSYAAGDEGKVVSNGELVAQGSDSVTQNGPVNTTLINSLLVNVAQSGTLVHSGSITPTERVNSLTFDCGVSDPDMILIVPHSESPMKSNGQTAVGGWYSKNTYYKHAVLKSNSSGASLNGAAMSATSQQYEMSGTVITLYSNRNNPSISAGSWETITYDWFVW